MIRSVQKVKFHTESNLNKGQKVKCRNGYKILKLLFEMHRKWSGSDFEAAMLETTNCRVGTQIQNGENPI